MTAENRCEDQQCHQAHPDNREEAISTIHVSVEASSVLMTGSETPLARALSRSHSSQIPTEMAEPRAPTVAPVDQPVSGTIYEVAGL